MLKKSEHALSGNDRYEGYCIDVLKEVARLRGFNYVIHEVRDKSYGSVNGHGVWNGMVGELVHGVRYQRRWDSEVVLQEADMAVASLTISYGRSEAIDFTVPYMHLGISILFKKPEVQDPSLFRCRPTVLRLP